MKMHKLYTIMAYDKHGNYLTTHYVLSKDITIIRWSLTNPGVAEVRVSSSKITKDQVKLLMLD